VEGSAERSASWSCAPSCEEKEGEHPRRSRVWCLDPHARQLLELPNLMTNLKTIYAKTEPFRFLKPIRRRQDFKILKIRNGMPRIITEHTNPRVSIRGNGEIHSLQRPASLLEK